MVFQNNLLMGAAAATSGGTAHTVGNSVILDSGDTANFSRTNATPTDLNKWTYSTWVKRGKLGVRQTWGLSVFTSSTAAAMQFHNYGSGSFDTITVSDEGVSGTSAVLRTNEVFLDAHAWYHFVNIYDTDNSNEDLRFRLFVNGVEVTTFATNTIPSSGATSAINTGGATQYLGRQAGSSNYGDGYIAEAVFCDGQAYEPENFGEWNNGVWRPKDPSGLTFGDNGFYLDFADSSALGNDISGNNNDFTANNLAAGDQSTDTPTNNQCILTPLYKSSDITLSQGNLKATGDGQNYDLAISSMAIPESGKWACEFTVSADATFPATLNFYLVGVTKMGDNNTTAGSASGYYLNIGTGEIIKGSSTIVVDTGGPYNGVFRIEYDADNDTITIFDDDTEVFPASTGASNTVGLSGEDSLHFGVGSYLRSKATFSNLSGTPSSGFKELSPANLDTPTIEDSSKYFQTVLYQGTGAVRSVDQGGASYFNKYGSGDRSNIIVASGNGGSYSPAAGDNLINGNLTDGPGITSYADDMNFKFQFEEAVHITEATIYFQSAGGNLGTWKWQGSNDDSTYTDISSNEDLTSAAVTNVITLDSIGATATYTFYRLIKVSGGTNSTQWEEFNFKVKPVASESTSDRSTFQPDLVWLKNRSQADTHALFDAGQGVTKYFASDSSALQVTNSNSLTSFDSDGFSLGTGANGFNDLGEYFASWLWKAGGGAGSSNEDGSINTTSTSVDQTSGISISIYTGNATSGATVGHGLGVTPQMLIIKPLDAGELVAMYHEEVGNTAGMYLGLNGGPYSGTFYWNDTSPGSSVFTLGNHILNNGSGKTNVVYAFAEKVGFSKFGKYYGTGSATIPPVVNLGFKPSFLIIKNISAAGDWLMYDNARSPSNEIDDQLLANSTAAETTGSEEITFLSTGFAPAATDASINTSGNTYIYAAWANNPFGGEETTNSTAY